VEFQRRGEEEDMNAILSARIESPVGTLRLAGGEDGLRLIEFCRSGDKGPPESASRQDHGLLAEAIRQLHHYFAGKLRDFDLPLRPEGTPFQLRVWAELQRIPYGTTISYRELARRIGNPRASRAVGLANGANPLPIVIPCHRVIGSNGALVGYGGGLSIKERLLELEGVRHPLFDPWSQAGRSRAPG
jgi:methylated-DNA-[protein]-cysteine S-methyltransferase